MSFFRTAWFALVLTVSLSGSGCAHKGGAAIEESADPVRILFIGNSLTYFNDLPAVVEQIANHDGLRRVEAAMIASGGATLEKHWRQADTLEKLRDGEWDFVVLQEQSQLGAQVIDGVRRMNAPDNFYKYARNLSEAARSAGADTAFLLTWSHKDKPEEQPLLDDAYSSIADEVGGILIPVGQAWDRMRGNNSSIELYYDNVHPNFHGTYLTAMVTGLTLIDGFPRSGGDVLKFTVAAEEPPSSIFLEVSIPPDIAEQLRAVAGSVTTAE